jgi:hypothetical protein
MRGIMLILPPKSQRSAKQQRTYNTAMSKISRLKKNQLTVSLTATELYEVLISKKDGEYTVMDTSKVIITVNSFKNVKSIVLDEKTREKNEATLKRFIDHHPEQVGLTVDILYDKYKSSGARSIRVLIIDETAPLTINNVIFTQLKTSPETKRYYAIARVMREKIRKLHDTVIVTQSQLTLNLINNGYVIERVGRFKRWSVIDATKPVTMDNICINYKGSD